MRELPRAAVIYIVLVALAAGTVLVLGLRDAPLDTGLVVHAAIFGVLAVVADLKKLNLGFQAYQSVAVAINFACAVALGPGVAAWVSGLASIAADVGLRKPFPKVLFNASAIAVCVAAGGAAYELLRQPGTGNADPANVAAFVGYAVVNCAVNYVLLTGVITLATKAPPSEVVVANYHGLVLQIVALYPLGALMAVTYVHFGQWLGVALLAVPTVAAYNSLNRSQQLREDTKAALEALADAIDHRDPYTAAHSSRVADYAGQIARVLNVPFMARETIIAAARVHDLGKIGTPDAVLRKMGDLTDAEWELMRRHPTAGAEILEKLPMYRDGARLVRSHHEHPDGSGYPDRLTGDELPLGALIIGVADAFDAMTTDRPYRKGLPPAEALARLRAGAGTQFLPEAVEALARGLADTSPAEVAPQQPPVPTRAEGPQHVPPAPAAAAEAAGAGLVGAGARSGARAAL
jgi:putative nucleotidyltransferase with HDIG domain